MDGYEAEVEELMGRYRRKLADISGLQQRIAEVQGSASSARQSVRVTVDAQGEITALEFPTGAYKRMTPVELAEEILATARQAKAKAQEAVRELAAPGRPDDIHLLDLVQGRVNPAEHFAADPSMPDVVKEYVDTGRVPGDPGGR